jgi:hypothetical protein
MREFLLEFKKQERKEKNLQEKKGIFFSSFGI